MDYPPIKAWHGMCGKQSKTSILWVCFDKSVVLSLFSGASITLAVFFKWSTGD
jgi:hypothetical protein